VSPLRDNVLKADDLADAVRSLLPGSPRTRRRDTAVILPHNCSRVAGVGFDSFPSDPKGQIALIRFRMKKSVPFDIESAALGYWAQSAPDSAALAKVSGAKEAKKIDVVAAVAPVEIIARYEAPFRAAGLAPGFVTTSALAMLP